MLTRDRIVTYHIFAPNIDRTKHNAPSAKEFYNEFHKSLLKEKYYHTGDQDQLDLRQGTLAHMVNAEYSWITDGKPCYKISPDTIEHFAKTPLNIPIKDFRMPYQSFVVRFPKSNGIEVLQDGKISEVQTAMFFISNGYLGIVYHVGQEDGSLSDRPFTMFAKIQSEDQTLEQMFHGIMEGFINERTDSLITSEVTTFLLSICAGVSIFATNTQFKAQYNSLEFLAEKCKGDKKKRLNKMAKKADHIGEIKFSHRDLNVFNGVVESKTVGIGQELKYRHIRAAYTRTQRFGPGRKFVKTVEIRQTVVRPDLPVKM